MGMVVSCNARRGVAVGKKIGPMRSDRGKGAPYSGWIDRCGCTDRAVGVASVKTSTFSRGWRIAERRKK